MAKGFPDWGKDIGETTVKVDDLGELAARLGSIDTIDRSGTVIFIDDGGLGLYPYTIVDGTAAELARVLDGKLLSGSAIRFLIGLDAGTLITITRRLALSIFSLTGIEFKMRTTKDASNFRSDLRCYLEVQSGDTHYQYGIAINQYTDRLLVYRKSGAVQVATEVFGGSTGKQTVIDGDDYVYVKLVVNPLTGKYVYVKVNGDVYDLSMYDALDTTTSTVNYLELKYMINNTVNDSYLFLGDIILTTNEIERST